MFYILNVGDFVPQLGYFIFNLLRINRVVHISAQLYIYVLLYVCMYEKAYFYQ
jgi:hypothetical protein